jgi:hypothetical protein
MIKTIDWEKFNQDGTYPEYKPGSLAIVKAQDDSMMMVELVNDHNNKMWCRIVGTQIYVHKGSIVYICFVSRSA